MTDYEIYIGGELVDISPGTNVGITLKASDASNILGRWVTSTNQFKLPFTKKNDLIYQKARDIRSNTTIPYKQQTIKIVAKGIEIMPRGLSYLKKSSNAYEVQAYATQEGFFRSITNKKVSDLDLSSFDGDFDPDTKMNTTEGVIFPVINYGDFDGTTIPDDTNLPSWYLHTIIDKIFEEAGYEKSGKVFTDDKYIRMIIPFSRPQFGYADSFTLPFKFAAKGNGDQFDNAPPASTRVRFQIETLESPNYNTSTSRYLGSPVVSFSDFYAQIEFTLVGDSSFDLAIYRNTASVLATVTAVGPSGVVVLDSRTLWPNGVPLGEFDYVEVIYSPFNTTLGDVTLKTRVFYNSVRTKIYTFGSEALSFGKLLPDMLQSDLILDFLVRFNLIFDEDHGVIVFKCLDDVIRDVAFAKDWTGKRVVTNENNGDDVDYTPLQYAKQNNFKYSTNDPSVNAMLGMGSIDIDNDNIDDTKDIYTSPFNNSETSFAGKINCAKIPIYDTSVTRETFDNEPGLHLLLVRQKNATEPAVNGVSAYKVAYFDDPNQDMSMSFQQAIEENYTLYRQILQRAKVVNRGYNLKALDIVDVSFLFPIFDADSHFLQNTISNFIQGTITEVELLKIGSP